MSLNLRRPAVTLGSVTVTEPRQAPERWKLEWADLYNEVVTSGLCTGCAACIVACPHDVLGYNTADTTGYAGMWTKTFTGLSGFHQVVAHWTVHWSSTIKANLGPHQANGQASASTLVRAVLYLVDETNGTYLNPANAWSSYSWTGNGTLVTIHSATVSIFVNQTLVGSHTYAIATWIYATTAVYAASTGGNTASATISLANAGGTTDLTSIVRT